MQHAEDFSIQRGQPVALEALMLPDGLKQFFRRRDRFVAQLVKGMAVFPPRRVEVSRPRTHPPIF
jgi:hypothetical protein